MSTKRASSLSATARLKQDYLRLKKDPVPYITAEPLPSNLLEWHYIVRGPENSSYEGGIYHGKLLFPAEFPFKPPGIVIMTPNGRFQCNKRLCLSISDFHPDTWNPAWSVSTILTGLLSFMLEMTPTLGSIETSPAIKRVFAAQSLEFNLKDSVFKDLFPDVVQEIKVELEKRKSLKSCYPKPEEADQSSESKPVSDRDHPDNEAAIVNPGADRLQFGGFSSLFVVLLFAVFAFIVRYVLMTIVES